MSSVINAIRDRHDGNGLAGLLAGGGSGTSGGATGIMGRALNSAITSGQMAAQQAQAERDRQAAQSQQQSPAQQTNANQGQQALQSGSNQAEFSRAELGPTGSTSVADHLHGILATDSPLNRQAETMGLQRANQRGLLNSSMAVGAAQDAVTSNALPIASQDAGFQQGLETQQQGHIQGLDELRASSLSNAWGVMANNMNQQSMMAQDSISAIQNNPDISGSEKTKMIDQVIQMRDADLKFQQSLYDSLSGYLRTSDVFPSL